MKIQNINIVLLGIALLFWTSFATAQDLTQATQSDISTSKNISPNHIAQQIMSFHIKGDFTKIAPFEISTNNLRTQHTDYIDHAVYLEINKDELRTLTATQKVQPNNLIRNRYNNAAYLSASNNCPTNLNVTTNYTSGNNIDLEASNAITASNTIFSGAAVDYDAGIQIDLLNGFHARFGCDFDAFIDGCGGLYRTDEGEQTPDYQSKVFKTTSTRLHTDKLTIRNYPNPFTGITTIEYSLPQAGQVSLTISDISGKTVARLLEDKAHEAGIYTLQLDASMLSPGIYISTLQTAKAIQTHKITVVK